MLTNKDLIIFTDDVNYVKINNMSNNNQQVPKKLNTSNNNQQASQKNSNINTIKRKQNKNCSTIECLKRKRY